MATPLKLNKTLSAIDGINAQDLTKIMFNNVEHPKELIYGKQMSACLDKYWSNSDEVLQIAVRAQHIKRWHLKRTEFDTGKAGYYQWRIALGKFHAQLTEQIMIEQGYDNNQAAAVASILRKENIKTNRNTQTLEDVACLVFLQHYFDAFAKKYTEKDDEAKIIGIVQKTWAKMSEQGHKIALTLTLPEHLALLVKKALTPN